MQRQPPQQQLRPARGTRPSNTKSFPLQLRSLPPALRPLVRAYILGYASSVVPRLLTLVLQHLSRARSKNVNCLPADKDERTFVDSALHILRTGLEPQRFPTFCAVLVGGATILQAEQFVSQMIDPISFVASCGLIMWAWFYAPDSLPRGYNKWITSAAHVDLRLIEALRRCKTQELRYHEETGQAPLLGSMCEDYNLPYEWGDPAKVVPFPCDIVHMGRGPSCEYHAWRRFWLSWRWSMYTYLPLALALQLRKPTRNSPLLALLSACRSSAFLATYITLFYYGVCLGRTRVGPHLIGKDTACRNRIDGGICVGVGCFLCGWSVLIETASRRKDMALFVAPRAMATLLPRRYPIRHQWRETLAFAASTAVVFTCAAENPKRVRGMMGGILGLTMRQ
ncbi:integral membrane protein [Purpureocillium lavendulum]|uniref:Integral membrane protein n=1 Tax=Purpureocillium lavendulum TaxID=1247861 RepID=A0AB34FSZ1_9HYPO|nr:integral membrane protein [Purpureocillium lavendulum]